MCDCAMILRQITKQQSYSLFQARRSYGALNKQCHTVTIVGLEELQLPTVVGTAGVLDISCPSCVIEECAWHGRGRSEYASRTYMIEGTHGYQREQQPRWTRFFSLRTLRWYRQRPSTLATSITELMADTGAE
jgi:hypothetical protein